MQESTPKRITDIAFPFDPERMRNWGNFSTLGNTMKDKQNLTDAALQIATRVTKIGRALYANPIAPLKKRDLCTDGEYFYQEAYEILGDVERSLFGDFNEVSPTEELELKFSDFQWYPGDHTPGTFTPTIRDFFHQYIYRIKKITTPVPDLLAFSEHDREIFLRLIGFDSTNKISVSQGREQMDIYFTRLTPTLGFVIADTYTQDEGVYRKESMIPLLLEPTGETGKALQSLVSKFVEKGGQIPQAHPDQMVEEIRHVEKEQVLDWVDAGIIDTYDQAAAVMLRCFPFDDLAMQGRLTNIALVRAFIDREHFLPLFQDRDTVYVEPKVYELTDEKRLTRVRKMILEREQKLVQIEQDPARDLLEGLDVADFHRRALNMFRGLEKILVEHSKGA